MNTLGLMRMMLFRPLDFYVHLQETNRPSWRQGIAIVLLAFAARMLGIVMTGYMFQTREPYEISFVLEFVWLVVPWLAWTVANWGVGAIMDGEGKYREVFVGSAFALVPYVCLAVPIALISNLFSLGEQSVYDLFVYGVYGWVGLLLLLKIRALHDFEWGKTIGVALLSIFGIVIIMIVSILMFSLVYQLIYFIVDLVKEAQFR